MTITGRVPLLLLLGLVPVVLRPALSTMWLWVLVVAALAALDLLLAGPPATLRLERHPTGTVRLGHPATTTLVASATGRRTLRLRVRDAWQPTAGATGNRHHLVLAPGGRSLLTTQLRPVRRGDLRATRVTVRSVGPLG
ncbi:MAG: DUF58 domain-containing protein, partial [Nocardioides sp.]|nr:DUF58 domain-containing protein [Nocardioides sp.]